MIRSVGTSKDRLAHTGGTHFKTEDRRIPALAISNPDADLLEREFASGRAVRMRLANTSQWADSTRSANVIGEIPGGSRRSEIVLLGAHLDSWDLGTGAHDDGAGVAIVTAAALRAGAARPARTIRVVLFANEEFGSSGSRNYVIRHAAELPRHVMGMESDLGAFHPWGLSSCVPLERLPLARAIHEVVEPLGIEFLGNQATGETDVGRLRDEGVPVMDVATDASEYFDYHHTANDTFDKIDPAQLRQNVAVYATVAYLAAQASTDFGRAPRKPKP